MNNEPIEEPTKGIKHNRKKIIAWIVGGLIVLAIIIFLIIYFTHKNGGGGDTPCNDLKKLDYQKFTDNANKYGKLLPPRVLDHTPPDRRYLIINNKCNHPVIMSDIGYADNKAENLSLLEKVDSTTDPDGTLRAYGGVYIPAGGVVASETVGQELYSGRIWPRVNCKTCPVPKGVQQNACRWTNSLSDYCPCPDDVSEGFTPMNSQTPNQDDIKKLFPTGSPSYCNPLAPDAAICNKPLYHIQCDVGAVPYACNSESDCGYIGTIKKNSKIGLNTGWGLGAIGMSGKGPTIPIEYTLLNDQDYYDSSCVDGWSNTPIAIGPIPDRVYCSESMESPFNAKPTATINFNQKQCPPELQYIIDGEFIGCLSLCQALNNKQHIEDYEKRSGGDTKLSDWHKATVSWSDDVNAKDVRLPPIGGVWELHKDDPNGWYDNQGYDQTAFKTKGGWVPSSDSDGCTPNPYFGNEDEINKAYKANDGKNCKFMIDLACCAPTRAGSDYVAGKFLGCPKPTDDTPESTNPEKNTINAFGCSPYDMLYYNADGGQHRDYYQRSTCWHTDWPALDKKWCAEAGIKDEYCHYGNFMKQSNPNSYSWQFDDLNSTYQAKYGDYYIELCPDTVPDDCKGPPDTIRYCSPQPAPPPPTPKDICDGQPKLSPCPDKKDVICCDPKPDASGNIAICPNGSLCCGDLSTTLLCSPAPSS